MSDLDTERARGGSPWTRFVSVPFTLRNSVGHSDTRIDENKWIAESLDVLIMPFCRTLGLRTLKEFREDVRVE